MLRQKGALFAVALGSSRVGSLSFCQLPKPEQMSPVRWFLPTFVTGVLSLATHAQAFAYC